MAASLASSAKGDAELCLTQTQTGSLTPLTDFMALKPAEERVLAGNGSAIRP